MYRILYYKYYKAIRHLFPILSYYFVVFISLSRNCIRSEKGLQGAGSLSLIALFYYEILNDNTYIIMVECI